MDRNEKGRKQELEMTRRFWRELQRAVYKEDKKDARYGIGLHVELKRSLFQVLWASGLDPSGKSVRDLTSLFYELVEAMKSSRENWQAFGKIKEYETRVYTGKDGIRLCQTSTIEVASPPPQAPVFLSIFPFAYHPD